MDVDVGNKVIPIACRFVPHDQWLVTHVDSCWKTTHLKQWLLSKCIPGASPPDVPPRHRPVSPITFASGMARAHLDDDGSDTDGFDLGGLSDDDYLSDSLDISSSISSYKRSLKRRYHAPNTSAHMRQQSLSSAAEPQTAQYTLLAFSTGQILEDDYDLSFYNLRPFELLELHNSGADLRLPREILLEYVLPCFEAKVRVSKMVWKDSQPQEFYVDKVKIGANGRAKISKARTLDNPDLTGCPIVAHINAKDEGKERRRQKAKLEWKERWLVIRQGIMTLCKHRTDVTVQTYPLDTLSSLEGAQQLEKMTCRVIAGPTRDRVLCCKFDSVPQKSHDIKQDPPVATRSPTQDRPPDDDNGRTLDDNSRLEGDESSGEWIVLDMMDEHAYAAILRILHRSASTTLSSIFLPTSSESSYPTPTSPGFPLSPTSQIFVTPNISPAPPSWPCTHPYSHDEQFSRLLDSYSPNPDSKILPYPEWRVNVVNCALMAGMGVVGNAMKWALWGDDKALAGGSEPTSKGKKQGKGGWATWHGTGTQFTESLKKNGSARERHLYGQDGFHGDSDDDMSEGSELEWEGWSMDLPRQKQVTEMIARHRRHDHRHPPSPKDRTLQRGRLALEPSAFVSAHTSEPLTLSSPYSFESLRPHRLHPLFLSKKPSPSSSTSAEQVSIAKGAGATTPRPISPYTSPEIRPADLDGKSVTMTTISAGPAEKGKGRSEESKNMRSTVTAGVSGLLRRTKGRPDKEKADDGSTTAGRTPREKEIERRPKTPQAATLSRHSVMILRESPKAATLRHARSGSSIGLRGSGTPMDTALRGARVVRGAPEFDHGPEGDAGESKRKMNSRGLVRSVSVKAERLMKGLDNAFVDGR